MTGRWASPFKAARGHPHMQNPWRTGSPRVPGLESPSGKTIFVADKQTAWAFLGHSVMNEGGPHSLFFLYIYIYIGRETHFT